jgi:FKBP12-rapamycin complex-associated protein
VDALSDCLQFLIKRQHRSTTGYLCQIYSNMMEGLNGNSKRSSTDDVEMHGSILVLEEMLRHTGFFMLPRFEEVCEVIFSLTSHPKALIRLEIVRLCPRLARACPSVFQRKFLAIGLDFLIQTAANPSLTKNSVIDLRPSSYVSLGQLSLAMKHTENSVLGSAASAMCLDSLHKRLPDIFSLVQAGLTSTSPQKHIGEVNITRAALNCGANVVKALGEHALPYVEQLLDSIYKSGLSDDLIESLRSIASSMPSKQVSSLVAGQCRFYLLFLIMSCLLYT